MTPRCGGGKVPIPRLDLARTEPMTKTYRCSICGARRTEVWKLRQHHLKAHRAQFLRRLRATKAAHEGLPLAPPSERKAARPPKAATGPKFCPNCGESLAQWVRG